MEFPVELAPDILQKAAKLKIEPQDFEEKFIRGGGAGGQKINKTASCVWLKHLPTGIDVKVQKHRERWGNRKSAYKLLINKIEEKVLGKKSEAAQKAFKVRKQKKRRSKRAKAKMMDEKSRRGGLKSSRSKVRVDRDV
ncbi:peptide chain release factor-like protein [Candidatus Peregrinibacteria bacterium]|jgi:peptide chain release factor|nr:peptide chain release factor-like protein [Candidatus Peregrinibacteria bacterium]MBT4631759.1 peptide chain release factor-like protein [Candidatus Peregrinibacteria bacterium]MBT5517270.1 peptide chain release factor-like protein [Candidatus Peregrinibacteria bacterium]MBT5824516.1 peptide chain release factor-like protein [Candidatus Peregrinibacteria bacterium]